MSILADMSFVIDAALLVALCICVFFLVRTSNAVGTLRKAQEETPRRIEELIETLEEVRSAVSRTLNDVSRTMSDLGHHSARVETLRGDVSTTADRLSRLLEKAEELADELGTLTNGGNVVADRILELTEKAKEIVARLDRSVDADVNDDEAANALEASWASDPETEENVRDDDAKVLPIRKPTKIPRLVFSPGKAPRVADTEGMSR